ncbi:hypothetical protein HZA85_03740 [Candidatus Uhrbacteria bacterium]|nr:hypothetical protein [Candidatus Uhrbacteria bacterium]
MSQLDEVYKRIQESKKRQKEIRQMLKDELAHHTRYQEILEEAKTLREEKKAIEQSIRGQSPDFLELEELKLEIQTDEELLSDVALNMYMKEETVEIVDEFEQTWHPIFKVSFKKTN